MADKGLAASVVVPTYNRRASLLRLLDSLDRQTLPADRFEVIVVDNNSHDDTVVRVAAWASTARARLRCISEPRQGAALARNRGIDESAAPIVAFIDDDAEAEPAWLEQILRGFDVYGADAIGGYTVAVWCASLPAWWLPSYEHAFLRNWGGDPRRVSEEPFFYSQNLAVLRATLEALGGFDPQLGPKGSGHIVGEDLDLCRRIHERGGTLYYIPDAVVRHHVPPERLTRRFLRHRFYSRGMTQAILRRLRGNPLDLAYQAKQLASGLPSWLAANHATERFRRELTLWRIAGYLRTGLVLALSHRGPDNRPDRREKAR